MRTICCSDCLGGVGGSTQGVESGGLSAEGHFYLGCLPSGAINLPLWTEFLTHACENTTTVVDGNKSLIEEEK